MATTEETPKTSIFKQLMKDMIDLANQNGKYPSFIVLGVKQQHEWTQHKLARSVTEPPMTSDNRETGDILLGAEILRSSKTSALFYIR